MEDAMQGDGVKHIGGKGGRMSENTDINEM